MATINLGRIKPVFKGAYASNTAYVVDDIVVYSDESYICIQAGTGQTPSSATAYWTKIAAKGTNGTNGTDVSTVLTTQGDILYRDGSGLQRLPKGSANQVLKMNSGATAPEYGTVSSDYVKIASGSTTASAYIDIQGCFSTDYKIYKLIIAYNINTTGYIEVGLLNASDNSHNSSTYCTFGGGQYSGSSSGNSRYTGGGTPSGAGYFAQSDSNGFRPINTWGCDKTDEHNQLEMTFDNPISTRKTMAMSSATWSQGSYVGHYNAIGMHDSTNSISGIRINSSGGNNFTTTGYYAVYGLKL